jgi:hypothetical protein
MAKKGSTTNTASQEATDSSTDSDGVKNIIFSISRVQACKNLSSYYTLKCPQSTALSAQSKGKK